MTSQTKFDALPDKVLENIISRLGTKSKLSARSVNHVWKQIIDSKVGHSLTIVDDGNKDRFQFYKDVKLNQARLFSLMKANYGTLNFHGLDSLTLMKGVGKSFFRKNIFESLRVLNITEECVMLSKIGACQRLNTIHLPCLQHLTINSFASLVDKVEKTVQDNLLAILSNLDAPPLKAFILTNQKVKINQGFHHHLNREQTWEVQILKQIKKIHPKCNIQLLCRTPNLKRCDIMDMEFSNELSTLSLDFYDGDNYRFDRISKSFWRSVLLPQFHLQALRLKGVPGIDLKELKIILDNNHGTIQHLVYHCPEGYPKDSTIDLSYLFGNCKHILFIEYVGAGVMINFIAIMSTVVMLTLMEVTVPSSEFNSFKPSKLRFLSFNSGNANASKGGLKKGDGIKVSDLLVLLRQRDLMNLEIDRVDSSLPILPGLLTALRSIGLKENYGFHMLSADKEFLKIICTVKI